VRLNYSKSSNNEQQSAYQHQNQPAAVLRWLTTSTTSAISIEDAKAVQKRICRLEKLKQKVMVLWKFSDIIPSTISKTDSQQTRQNERVMVGPNVFAPDITDDGLRLTFRGRQQVIIYCNIGSKRIV
jgi:hypothetical protein